MIAVWQRRGGTISTVLVPPLALTRLQGLVARPRRFWRAAVVDVDLDPLELVAAGAHLFGTAIHFGMPGSAEVGALGVAWRTVSPYGGDRFAVLASELAALPVDVPDARLLVGFSFAPEGPQRPEWDGFPATTAVLPLIAVTRGPSARTGRLVVVLPPGRSAGEVLDLLASLERPGTQLPVQAADHILESRPTPSAWMEMVSEAVAAIRGGALDKVVLARCVTVRSDVAPDPFSLVARLRAGYPGCYSFGWQQGEATFVGATPELLVARSGDALRSHPLAGSAPRSAEEEEDRALGQVLMASAKDRAEHRMVVDDIAARLRPLARRLSVSREPSLRRMANVQHLSTEISATLTEGRSVVELAGVLHPTAAVGGVPRSEALALIAKAEGLERGWYAGGIGWVDQTGDGELAIALRCALLRDDTAYLYAGSGIVADSDPAAELEETRLKLRPLLDLLAEA